MLKINVSELHPKFRDLTRKRLVYVHTFRPGDTVNCHGTYWDGGSISRYTGLDLLSGRRVPLKIVSSKPIGYGNSIDEALIDNGVAVLQTGVSCGKDAPAHIHLLEDDLCLLLAVAKPKPADLTTAESVG